MLGRNIAILTAPTRGNGARGLPAEAGRCLLVDPKTGKVLSSKSISEHVALAEDFKAEEVDRLWRLLGSADADQAEQATQGLIAGGSHAAEALASRVSLAKPLSAEQVQQLIGLLSSADATVRERATTDLNQAGPSLVSAASLGGGRGTPGRGQSADRHASGRTDRHRSGRQGSAGSSAT
jgi:hypothetical protein